MNIINTNSNTIQPISLNDRKDSIMNEYERYVLMPYVDELITDYGTREVNYISISLDNMPLEIVIELTEHYYKAKEVVSYELLRDLLEERANERFHAQQQSHGLVQRQYLDNGEYYYTRRF